MVRDIPRINPLGPLAPFAMIMYPLFVIGVFFCIIYLARTVIVGLGEKPESTLSVHASVSQEGLVIVNGNFSNLTHIKIGPSNWKPISAENRESGEFSHAIPLEIAEPIILVQGKNGLHIGPGGFRFRKIIQAEASFAPPANRWQFVNSSGYITRYSLTAPNEPLLGWGLGHWQYVENNQVMRVRYTPLLSYLFRFFILFSGIGIVFFSVAVVKRIRSRGKRKEARNILLNIKTLHPWAFWNYQKVLSILDTPQRHKNGWLTHKQLNAFLHDVQVLQLAYPRSKKIKTYVAYAKALKAGQSTYFQAKKLWFDHRSDYIFAWEKMLDLKVGNVPHFRAAFAHVSAVMYDESIGAMSATMGVDEGVGLSVELLRALGIPLPRGDFGHDLLKAVELNQQPKQLWKEIHQLYDQVFAQYSKLQSNQLWFNLLDTQVQAIRSRAIPGFVAFLHTVVTDRPDHPHK